ncbi:hypothetical protein CR513_28619, partial [Mucuna pruriens]
LAKLGRGLEVVKVDKTSIHVKVEALSKKKVIERGEREDMRNLILKGGNILSHLTKERRRGNNGAEIPNKAALKAFLPMKILHITNTDPFKTRIRPSAILILAGHAPHDRPNIWNKALVLDPKGIEDCTNRLAQRSRSFISNMDISTCLCDRYTFPDEHKSVRPSTVLTTVGRAPRDHPNVLDCVRLGLINPNLIKVRAKLTTPHFGIEGSPTSKIVNEVVVVDNQRLENKIIELTYLVRQLAIRQHHSSPSVRECGMCASIEHPPNTFPIYQPPPPFRPEQSMQVIQQSFSKELVKQMATNNIQFQENVSATIQDLQTQIDQLATTTILSPQANIIDITLRSGVVDIIDENAAKVVEVVTDQPPLPSIVQPLHAPIITANKIQKPPKDVILEVLRRMRRRLPQAITNRSGGPT